MNHIEDNLARFNTTTLEGLKIIKLLRRYDTKFIFPKDQLTNVFDYLSQHYETLDIAGKRFFKYENLYYDTDDYFFYHQHHNRNLGRYKVRFRRYVDTNQCYFEVKYKNNKSQTIKNRLFLGEKDIDYVLSKQSKEFARDRILTNNGDIVDQIKPKLRVDFNRITFANLVNKERLTIDVNLTYINGGSFRQKLSNLAIAELKSAKHSPNSPFYQYLKGFRILPLRISKYCIGIAMTDKNIKYNRFKRKLIELNKLN